MDIEGKGAEDIEMGGANEAVEMGGTNEAVEMGEANQAVEIREVNEAIGRRQYVTTILYYTYTGNFKTRVQVFNAKLQLVFYDDLGFLKS